MGRNQYWAGRVYDLCVYYMTGTPEAQPKVVLWGAGNRTCNPWFTRHSAYPLHHGGIYGKPPTRFETGYFLTQQ